MGIETVKGSENSRVELVQGVRRANVDAPPNSGIIPEFDFEDKKRDGLLLACHTLPFQKHGVISGTVKTISKDIFHKQTALGDTLTFRARTELPPDPSAELKNLPPGFLCIPGLTLSAEINVGKRTVIEYFLYPILEGLDTGLREPK